MVIDQRRSKSEVVLDGTGLSVSVGEEDNPPIEVQWDDGSEVWKIVEQDTGQVFYLGESGENKTDVEAKADDIARVRRTERISKNKDGSIGKGPSSRSSFGNDPESSEG